MKSFLWPCISPAKEVAFAGEKPMPRIVHPLARLGLNIMLILGLCLCLPAPAHADIAPPDQPPGANPLPESLDTQVSMLAETVVIKLLDRHPEQIAGQARVSASFTMRNLGSVDERLTVRFPLSFFDGRSNGFGEYPTITDLQVRMQGRSVSPRRIEIPNPSSQEGLAMPWAVFEADFPVQTDVVIDVTYTAAGIGEYPIVAFKYVLETGAGWRGPIGSATIVVQLPYEANAQNVIFAEHTGFSQTSPGGVIAGKEVRWQFTGLEPSRADNFEVSLVMPEAWKKVLYEQSNVARDPTDSEAWGRLGKYYKELCRLRHAYRQDPGGLELYQASRAAYQRAVDLSPADALWHYGFADLLWGYYYPHVYLARSSDTSELELTVQELRTALQLDPTIQAARDLLDDISASVPGAVEPLADGYNYLILTATPDLWPSLPTASATLSPGQNGTAQATEASATAGEPTTTPRPTPSATPTLTPVILAEVPPGSITLAPPEPTPTPTRRVPTCRAFLALPLLMLTLSLAVGARRLKRSTSPP
jgi:hypothetical protein